MRATLHPAYRSTAELAGRLRCRVTAAGVPTSGDQTSLSRTMCSHGWQVVLTGSSPAHRPVQGASDLAAEFQKGASHLF